MIRLIEINEENWLRAAALEVTEEQKKYLDSPVGIIARGYEKAPGKKNPLV